MVLGLLMPKFRTIFSPCNREERDQNFESYWAFMQESSGEIIENEKTLVKKKNTLNNFQLQQIRSQSPLSDPEHFYRNYLRLIDDPQKIDKKTLLLTCIYKFARHEWVGISAAWDSIPSMAQAKTVKEKISRYHLCEEFCHARLFNEMFRTFHLEDVQWISPGKGTQWGYKIFPRLPEWVMSGPAFLSELMGMMFYLHLDRLLDEVFADEIEARDRLRQLLHEIMVDELAHIGQRRNYMGNFSIKLSKSMFRPLLLGFFRSIPEAKYFFNFEQMIQDGLAFDYNHIPESLIERSWVPTYCQNAHVAGNNTYAETLSMPKSN